MSTYDGAYQTFRKPKSNYTAKGICCCGEDKVNSFCKFHGKYGNGSFKNSEEYKQLIEKLNHE